MDNSWYHRKRGRQENVFPKLLGLLGLCLFMMVTCIAASGRGDSKGIHVFVNVPSVEILQDEAIPELTFTAVGDADDRTVLGEESDYTLGDLLAELNDKNQVTVNCGADGLTEGKFPINVNIPQRILNRFETEWADSVNLEIEKGTVTVLNKYGTWEENKFLRYDGTYVVSDFVVSKGSHYYLDDNGEIYTGFLTKDNLTYYFGADGRSQTGWVEDGGSRYYVNDNGTLHVGWLNAPDGRYYLDENGRAVTGAMQVGIAKCEFNEDGLLISEELLLDPNKPMVALTFDDGPGPRTMELVNRLKQYNAHATFFMLGSNVGSYPDSVKAMLEAGCELGNHSYNHPDLSTLSYDGVAKQMGDTDWELQQAAGQGALTMRPPYGAISGTVREAVGKPMILWSMDTLDWQHRNAQTSIDYVMGNVYDGAIVLMHDIHTESVDAALELIPRLLNAGYQLVTVSEMAQAKGYELTNGEKYFSFD